MERLAARGWHNAVSPPLGLKEVARTQIPGAHAGSRSGLYYSAPLRGLRNQYTRAELINGVVLMPSPVGPAHGRAQFPTIAWLSYYVENTPGVKGTDNALTALGLKSEPQPDVLLRILPLAGFSGFVA
jgi:hypothetical protein